MENNHDQLKLEFSETDKESISVRLISIFLVLVFALIPLAEIVTDFHYNDISHQPTISICASDWNYADNILSFKEIK